MKISYRYSGLSALYLNTNANPAGAAVATGHASASGVHLKWPHGEQIAQQQKRREGGREERVAGSNNRWIRMGGGGVAEAKNRRSKTK